jgi:DNA invertase Pin-like site-specific DNA recombinase
MTEKIRFAPLIRVSSERQERQGESLHTQRKQLESAIAALNGTVYEWYAGQEHATPENERQILERLMQDAKAHKFDAIMVADATRWSRDNGKSKDYLEILRKNSIRFFVRNEEMNLFYPLHIFILGMSVEVGEFFGREQAYKSIINRIERAKKGYPSSGHLPYGRTFDKETSMWSIIPNLKVQVEEMAHLYLYENATFEQLSRKYKIQGTYIHKILTKRSGDMWEQHFENKNCGIKETVETTVPRLLPDHIIEAIKAKCQSRKIIDHGSYKHQYLLARFIYDAETGYALTGTPAGSRNLYYRTYKPGTPQYQVRANLIENAIQDAVFEALSDNSTLYRYVFDGEEMKDMEGDLLKKRAKYQKDLATQTTKLSNYADAIGNYEGKSIQTFLKSLEVKISEAERKINELESTIALIDAQLQSLPTKHDIQTARVKLRQDLQKSIEMSAFQTGATFRSLPFEDRRALLKLLFAGKDAYGKRYGIYVTMQEKNQRYSFVAYGRLGNVQGHLTNDEYVSDASDMYKSKDEEATESLSDIIKNVDITDKSICTSSG